MNAFPHNSDSHLFEPLPGDCSPTLREIDARLRDLAMHASTPMGLSDRVFAASIHDLHAAHGTVATLPRLRLVGGSSLWLRRATWARLAMAASLALALGVSMQIVQNQQDAINMAQRDALDTELEVALALRPLSDSTSQLENEFSPLLKVSDWSSPEPVILELDSRLQAVEG